MTRCTVCEHGERPSIDALTGLREHRAVGGPDVRRAADHPGPPQAHAHDLPSSVRPDPRRDWPTGQADPLAEAISLAARARTPREKLRGLEQVRAATKLRMRGVELDPEDRRLLDDNIAEAEAAYKAAGDFETQARALSGWRESLLHRLEAVQAADAIETRLIVSWPGSDPEAEGTALAMRPGDYWAQVPARLRDPDRFRVESTIRLRFAVVARGEPADVAIKVRDRDGVLVWANERASDSDRRGRPMIDRQTKDRIKAATIPECVALDLSRDIDGAIRQRDAV